MIAPHSKAEFLNWTPAQRNAFVEYETAGQPFAPVGVLVYQQCNLIILYHRHPAGKLASIEALTTAEVKERARVERIRREGIK